MFGSKGYRAYLRFFFVMELRFRRKGSRFEKVRV